MKKIEIRLGSFSKVFKLSIHISPDSFVKILAFFASKKLEEVV